MLREEHVLLLFRVRHLRLLLYHGFVAEVWCLQNATVYRVYPQSRDLLAPAIDSLANLALSGRSRAFSALRFPAALTKRDAGRGSAAGGRSQPTTWRASRRRV